MRCPKCDSPRNRVLDSRNHHDQRVVYRRRQCSDCQDRFTTYEVVHGDITPYTQSEKQLAEDLQKLQTAIDLMNGYKMKLRNMIQAQKRGQNGE